MAFCWWLFSHLFFTHCPNGASLDFDAALGVGPFLNTAIFDEGFGLHGFLAENGGGFVADDAGGEAFAIDGFLGAGGPCGDLADAEFLDRVFLEGFAHQFDRIDGADRSGGCGCCDGCGFCRCRYGRNGLGLGFRFGGCWGWCRVERHQRELFDQVGFINRQHDFIFRAFDEELDIGWDDFYGLEFAVCGEIDDNSRALIFDWYGGKDRDLLGKLIGAERGKIDVRKTVDSHFVADAVGDAGDGEAEIGFEFVTEVSRGADDGNRDEMLHR